MKSKLSECAERTRSVPSKPEQVRLSKASHHGLDQAAGPNERDDLAGERKQGRPDRPHPSGLADERFFTVKGVAEILNVCERTVRRKIKRNKLMAYDIDGMTRIAESDLANFLARRRRI